jgi:hypothetical protein
MEDDSLEPRRTVLLREARFVRGPWPALRGAAAGIAWVVLALGILWLVWT